MATYTEKLKLYKVDPIADANQTFNIQTMLNDNWDKLDAGLSTAVEEATKNFDALAMQPGNKTTDTLVTGPDGKDTWTSVVTNAGGEELARKVDVEGVQSDGKAVWTTTITLAGQAAIVITDKETENGWVKEVQ